MRNKISLRRPKCIEEIRSTSKNTNTLIGTYSWKALLENPRDSETNKVLSVCSIYDPPLRLFLKVVAPGLKVEVIINDYDDLLKQDSSSQRRVFWIASVLRVKGYYLLLRYMGMEEDDSLDFWVNLGSDEIRNLGYCSSHVDCEILPPESIRKRHNDWASYILGKLHDSQTFTRKFEEERRNIMLEGRFKVGTRVELLDRYYSTRVRPARVVYQLGRRICVRVAQEDLDKDCAAKDKTIDDIQISQGVWMDESCGLIFPVGWAVKNGYGLMSNNQYREHCNAILNGSSTYNTLDAIPEKFNVWKRQNEKGDGYSLWKKDMKFECLDPLNQSFLELRVATCLKVLEDGYMTIGFDGPEMDEEAIPIHCSSPLLFPAGYADKYGITLKGPGEEENTDWDLYIKQCQKCDSEAKRAPENLFDRLPRTNKIKKFEINAKLEAVDQCEPNLICPSRIIEVLGRLIRIKFDGWPDDFDQLFDYRSRDLFPLGWCEMYGYKLEQPKNETLKKNVFRKRKKQK